VAPSAINPAGTAFTRQGMTDFVTPRALATSEIPALIEEFRIAAHHAKTAGFDGVEVHGANGYLLDQFLRDGTNQRTDQYGGSIANRTRLLQEVVAAVCEVWGTDRVGVRISPLNQYNDIRDSHPQARFSQHHLITRLEPDAARAGGYANRPPIPDKGGAVSAPVIGDAKGFRTLVVVDMSVATGDRVIGRPRAILEDNVVGSNQTIPAVAQFRAPPEIDPFECQRIGRLISRSARNRQFELTRRRYQRHWTAGQRGAAEVDVKLGRQPIWRRLRDVGHPDV